jgi:hypothetical protein
LAGETACPTIQIQAFADYDRAGIQPAGTFSRKLLECTFTHLLDWEATKWYFLQTA